MNAHDKVIMNNLMSQLHAIICEECYKIEDSSAGIAGQPRWEPLRYWLKSMAISC